MTYAYQHADLQFSKGGFDEKIILDRYSTPEHRFSEMNIGDTVVVKPDREKDGRKVGTLTGKELKRVGEINVEFGIVELRELDKDGELKVETGSFHYELMTKPLDLQPVHFWERWAKAGASVEKEEIREGIEDKFREHLFDDFQYSLGGRIMLMAGQEYVTGVKADLTAYNCYVGASPEISEEDGAFAASTHLAARRVFRAIIANLKKQAEIMARGGGYGINYHTVPDRVLTPRLSRENIALYLPYTHPDFKILENMKRLGKFEHVTVVTEGDMSGGVYHFNGEEYTVVKVEDSRGDLVQKLDLVVQFAYLGKKVLFDFSGIRHKGALVKGVNGRSSGAPSWMQLYDLMAELLSGEFTDAVELMELPSQLTGLTEQGGSRRGALMLMIPNKHKNVLKFITRKETPGKLTNANVSVAIDDAFMEAVFAGKEEESIIWNAIIESAWKAAEPGVVFLQYYNEMSNSWYFAEIICTNPCGKVA